VVSQLGVVPAAARFVLLVSFCKHAARMPRHPFSAAVVLLLLFCCCCPCSPVGTTTLPRSTTSSTWRGVGASTHPSQLSRAALTRFAAMADALGVFNRGAVCTAVQSLSVGGRGTARALCNAGRRLPWAQGLVRWCASLGRLLQRACAHT
jgi:hypothetical protein